MAAACGGLLVVTYLAAAHIGAAQRFEAVVLRSSSGASPRFAAGLLDTITAWSVTPAVAGVWALGWRRGGPLLGGVAAGVILASIGTADLLQHALPLACSGCKDRSFPSGHAAVGTSVMCGLLLIGSYRFRDGAALLASAVMSAVAALTVTARWHRPSDTVGSALIVLIYACAAVALLARCGRIRVVARNPGGRAVAVTALRAQAAIAGAIACGCLIITRTGPAGSQWIAHVALIGGLAITVATGGLTALVMLALLRNWCISAPSVRASSAALGRPFGGTAPDAELVPFRVGEHHPSGPVRPAPIVKRHRAKTSCPLDLFVPLGRGRPQVEMDAVLRRFPLRDAQEQQPGLTRSGHDQHRVVLRHVAGPDLALQERSPERGQRVRVARVEGDLVDLQGAILAVRHDAPLPGSCTLNLVIALTVATPGNGRQPARSPAVTCFVTYVNLRCTLW
jgi:PAP2 superfamily